MPLKITRISRWLLCLCILVLPVSVILTFSNPVSADGGPWVDSDLWSYLTEGQQVAVITAESQDTAKVDLFVSILDKTSQSHEISFFLPLGTSASDFYVVEQDVNKFGAENTAGLDGLIRSSANSKHTALTTLFAGSVLSNGFLLAPLWAPVLLSSCKSSEPVATFHTTSSDVSIFDVSADTDINELSTAAGLPDSVRNTLAQLRGQQIAVVKLRTQPQSSGSSSPYYYSRPSEPGIHLSWTSSLVSLGNFKTFTYSLGTGGAWSKPIEMTRVYISVPPGMDFSIKYPKLGSEQSGYTGIFGNPRIASFYQLPAYAVDEARGDFGRVWRITYTQSNPTEDIVVTFTPQSGWSKFQSAVAENSTAISFAFAIILAPLLWVIAWIVVMPRMTRKGGRSENTQWYHFFRARWYHALIYPGVNAVLIVFPGTILFLTLTLGLVIPSLTVLLLLFGGMSLLVFWLTHAKNLGVNPGRALSAFVLTSLISNIVYLALALGFAAVSGII